MRRNVFIVFLGLFLALSPRRIIAQTVLTKDGLAEDVQILRRAMVQLHPGLYRFNTPGGIESAFRALEQDFDRPRSLRYAFLALSRFTAKIRCGRTYPSFWNQNEATVREVWGGADKLPFLFRWQDGRMVVTASMDERLKPGDEIFEINGVRVDELSGRLLAHIKADGSNDANRWAQLELTGQREHEAFDIYQPLLVPPGGEGYQVILAGDEPPGYTLRPVARKPAPRIADQWSYEVLDGRLAHLRMGSFDVYDGKFDWKGFLADAFGDMKARGLRHVALDIRGNEGGADEVLVELAKYVVWQPAVMPGVQRLTRYETVPADVRPYLTASDRAFFDLRGKVTDAPGGMFLYRDAEREALEPGPDALIAKYYLLVDGHNAAAAFTLAQFLQENKLATLIGGTTGGNQRGINGGKFFFLKLPNSGIEIDIPLIASVPLDARPDGGLEPDVRVAADGALAEARRLARRE
ncbi:MAG: S41 family peptidase [Acidobacteriota bacterium]